MSLKKNLDADVSKLTPVFFVVGLVVVLGFCLVMFEYKTFETKITEIMQEIQEEEVEEKVMITQSQSAPPPPPPPPPPPAAIDVIDIVNNDVVVEDVPITDVNTSENDNVTTANGTGNGIGDGGDTGPVEDNTVFEVVEDQARYPGCENEKDNDAAFACFNEKIAKFLSKNVKYPSQARENNVQGTVYVEFIIEKDGSVTNPKALRDPGFGLGDEAVRVVKLLPTFIPAKQRGRPVRVLFRLPVKFTLNG